MSATEKLLQGILDALTAQQTTLAAIHDAIKARPATKAASKPAPSRGTVALPTTFPNYGKSKGAPISGATEADLDYYANGARRSIADPEKARFHDKERALLEAIDAERAKRAGGPPAEDPNDGFGPPPPGFDEPSRRAEPDQEDIPF